MQPVQKRKPNKSSFILIIFLIAAVIAAYFVIRFLKTPKVPPPPVQADRSEVLLDIEKNAIEAIQISSLEHGDYTLVQKDQKWHVMGHPSYPLNQADVCEMAQACAYIKTAFPVSSVSDQEAGLARPLRIQVTDKDKGTYDFAIGGRLSPQLPYRYFKMNGRIYAVSSSIFDVLHVSLASLHPLPRIDFNPELLSGFTYKSGANSFRIERLTTESWTITEPIRYPVSAAFMRQLFEKINALRFAVYVDEEKPGTLQTYGFLDAEHSIVFDLSASIIRAQNDEKKQIAVAPQTLTISFGKNVSTFGFYCCFNHRIYQATNLSMGFFRAMELQNIVSKQLITHPISAIQSIVIQNQETVSHYTVTPYERINKNNSLAKDRTGKQIYDLEIRKNNVKIDSDAFLRQYLQWMEITCKGLYLPPKDLLNLTPRFSIEITLITDEKQRIEFYPFDALHMLVSIDGTAISLVEQSALDLLMP